MEQPINILKDDRVECISVLTNMEISDYLELVENAYKNKGGIEGQRQSLKTKTAMSIRERMVDDIGRGTILPPIVIGVVIEESEYEIISKQTDNTSALLEFIGSRPRQNISIIDGMQRTTAILDVVKRNSLIQNKNIRVEYWISSNTNSLLYRMLILNTGQVPWNMRRQVEILFNSLISEIGAKVKGINLIEIDENGNRKSPGSYQADKIVELYLVFGSRNYKVDTKESLADEFTKLDFIDATAKKDFGEIFFGVLESMCKFDSLIFNYKPESNDENSEGNEDNEHKAENLVKFKKGKDLFGSQTARVGFIAAFATEIFGIPGEEKTYEEQQKKWEEIKKQMTMFYKKLEVYNDDQISELLDYMTLNQKVGKVTTKVGDFEREFFTKSFRTLIKEEFRFNSLSPCWRS
ncbi:hypothetical protein HQN89_34010 [Paenibacillus frigoriresistens]|uniref:hypothetical protein n=1 Tax=Paenibacillus alginolyticus TaxID=59839 RepID=UPI001566C655|nr:hypothetical protein [Paenibacillus frigoriresistens]NRF95829.1 hypothetical protein [Paenibacillus frigoriresistens]